MKKIIAIPFYLIYEISLWNNFIASYLTEEHNVIYAAVKKFQIIGSNITRQNRLLSLSSAQNPTIRIFRFCNSLKHIVIQNIENYF